MATAERTTVKRQIRRRPGAPRAKTVEMAACAAGQVAKDGAILRAPPGRDSGSRSSRPRRSSTEAIDDGWPFVVECCPRFCSGRLGALPKADNPFDARLRVGLVVEGGDHRRARPGPLGDVAVIRVRARGRGEVKCRSAEGSSRRVCGLRRRREDWPSIRSSLIPSRWFSMNSGSSGFASGRAAFMALNARHRAEHAVGLLAFSSARVLAENLHVDGFGVVLVVQRDQFDSRASAGYTPRRLEAPRRRRSA